MPLQGEYLGITLQVADEDRQNLEFFQHCGRHELRLQRWKSNGLLSYPPGTACPWDGSTEYEWARVDARGTVLSYIDVQHPIHPAYRGRTPYLVLLVELDEQRGQPSEHEALRIVGNLVAPDGALASSEVMAGVGIGTRVKMVFIDVGPGFALPQWTIDDGAPSAKAWRYGDRR